MTSHVMTDPRPAGRQEGAAGAPRRGMRGGLPTGPNHIVHAHVLGRATDRLLVQYGDVLAEDLVRGTVQQAYRELEATARLHTFLPVLAARVAEDRLRRLAREARTAAPATGAATTATVPAAATTALAA
ncbi:hypothetical protein E7744_13720 [Citricoccus sp. SGAir0253]|uniref:three-helix bundle dimerization domain-containing protein n=1 Tax=Citricoccus sp. SGAir0253 TaxID=2567881 RepID=UPI0010CD48E1|nr:hypothetical protein [Citricoccus sp. SGAir0253]QCU79071.1 hypothetical protein E7744_13720 [Citricoccus sp. SGAir0253]